MCVRACRVFWVNTARLAAGLLPRLRCEESLVPGMGSLITLIRAEAVGWHPKAVTGARSALLSSAKLCSALLGSPRAPSTECGSGHREQAYVFSLPLTLGVIAVAVGDNLTN